jgi:hypothetical protein
VIDEQTLNYALRNISQLDAAQKARVLQLLEERA